MQYKGNHKQTNKQKRQLTQKEKIFANDGADKAVVFKIYKQLMQIIMIKISNLIKKKELNRHFSKDTNGWQRGTWKDVQHHKYSV